MDEFQVLLDLLKSNEPLVAMLAPSFPIDFDPKKIVSQLKSVGFQHVVEVSAGAIKTNEMVIAALNDNPKARFITSPCPNIVRLIRNKYPEAQKYLTTSADSPMTATAKLVREKFPNTKPVFVGPCLVKKLEAKEDHPELDILCVTYRDIQQIFSEQKIELKESGKELNFDLVATETRLYPISGGLVQSSNARDLLAEEDIEVVSGAKNIDAAIQRFLESDHIRLLDILFCDGGCISGPGIVSSLTTDERRKKVIDFWHK